jgi:hypothetical protein
LILRLLLVAFFALPGVAQAGRVLDRTVQCLRTHPVCDLSGALSKRETAALKEEIKRTGAGPTFIAVLPGGALDEVKGPPAKILTVLHARLGNPGTYAVVAGPSFRAAATPGFPHAVPLAEEAFNQHSGEGVKAVLADFIRRVAEARQTGGADAGGGFAPAGGSPDGGGGSSALPLAILGLLGLGGGGLFMNARRQRRLREERQLAEVKEVARDDLVGLGDDIRALDLDVEVPGADPAAKTDYGRAVELYDRANTGFERARRPADLAPVTQALEEGRFAMTSARARLDGEGPPERRPPCFFDPRHGPSARDVPWAPEGGVPRPVPACEADAQRVEAGLDPRVREIDVHGRRVPYWNAPAYYGPWSGGYFGGFGPGLVGGLFLGEMLGGWGGQDVFVDNVTYDDPGGGDFGGGADF